ncbi:MAG TPA: hypothetical protein VF540_04675 [Segetibacter sp.]
MKRRAAACGIKIVFPVLNLPPGRPYSTRVRRNDDAVKGAVRIKKKEF